MAQPEPWGTCDRCNFRYLRRDLVWQFDWRGTSLANLRILVCTQTCLDVPQEQERAILVGPDPIPVRDPRPGWQASQQGYTSAPDILELLDGDLIPGTSGGSGTLGNDGGVLYLIGPNSYPTSDLLVSGGGFYSNGGEITIAPGSFTPAPSVPLLFGGISASQLLTYGAKALPTVAPSPGSGILWNPWGTSAGGPVYIA